MNTPYHRLVGRNALVTLLAIFMHSLAAAQTDSLAGLGADDLFLRARVLAFNGERDGARILLQRALTVSPSYADVRILLARTYAWDGRRDTARTELHQVLSDHPEHRDAWSALVDVELWDDKLESALGAAGKALTYYPNDPEFMIRKARALRGLGRDREALSTLNALDDVHPSSAGSAELRKSIQSAHLDRTISLSYATDRYGNYYDPMHYTSLQLGQRMSFGSLIGRINHSRRFGKSGLQAEMDAYPLLGDGMYAYLSYGYSANSLFPEHRFGAEVFRGLPWSLEGSLGFRAATFGPGSHVSIYTGSIGLYRGNYWFSLRPYITPGSSGTSQSVSLTIRRYLQEGDNFVSLRVGAGFSPDERIIQSDTGATTTLLYHLKSQNVGIGWQQMLASNIGWTITADYANQELSFLAGEYVALWSIAMTVRYRF